MTSKKYWLEKSKLVYWNKKPTIAIKNKSRNYVKWFPDGKLNIFDNCVTKNLENGLKDKIAIYDIGKDKKIRSFTYEFLSDAIKNFSQFLTKKLDSKSKNPKIMIHGSASIETTVTMMACANLGIHFSVIFEDLAPEAILNRIKLIKPVLFITRINNKEFSKKFSKNIMKKKLKFIYINSEIISKNVCKNISNKKKSYDSNRDFFTLFTSGSTGTPKGIVHSSGGYLVATKLTCRELFGMNKNSVVVTASNAGWLNGHTYALFGPLSLGATTILLEDPMLLLDEMLLRKVLNLKVSILYLPVTIIRLMKSLFHDKNFKTKFLKTLGSMGEHLAPSVAEWFANSFTNKNKAIINAYYQTENGAIISSPSYKDKISKVPHGSVGKPVTKYLKINKILPGKKAEIKLKTSWPGNMKRVLNGHKEWNKYWDKKGNFRMFDLATKKNGNFFVHGRNDDVINVRGHRIGCEEIESVILKINKIHECCVVSLPDKYEGETLYYFVAAKSRKLNTEIRNKIVENFGSFAIPARVYYVKELPKTRSGKILRRLLRTIILKPRTIKNSELNVMANKNIFNEIVKEVEKNE